MCWVHRRWKNFDHFSPSSLHLVSRSLPSPTNMKLLLLVTSFSFNISPVFADNRLPNVLPRVSKETAAFFIEANSLDVPLGDHSSGGYSGSDYPDSRRRKLRSKTKKSKAGLAPTAITTCTPLGTTPSPTTAMPTNAPTRTSNSLNSKSAKTDVRRELRAKSKKTDIPTSSPVSTAAFPHPRTSSTHTPYSDSSSHSFAPRIQRW